MALKKLSKSDGPPVYTKAQVFKMDDKWLSACQNGCPNKYVEHASHALAFTIAWSHMEKRHLGLLRSERIHP
jgi:hypothetical protein